jgi:hypothetical protein
MESAVASAGRQRRGAASLGDAHRAEADADGASSTASTMSEVTISLPEAANVKDRAQSSSMRRGKPEGARHHRVERRGREQRSAAMPSAAQAVEGL